MAVTTKEQLLAIVDDLDDKRASEVLAFALRALARPSNDVDGLLGRMEPGIDVDRETLWEVARPITDDDPLWTIVGLLDDDGPTDMSSNKHAYLAEIYANLHDK